MAAVRDFKRKMVDGLIEVHLRKYRTSGAELVMRSGKFIDAKTIKVALGFLKALIADDDRILGFTAFGVEAGEAMAVVQVAMANDLPYAKLRDAILTHPTIAEGLTVLFANFPEKA